MISHFKVNGLMLANHTCMSQLFSRSLQQFDRIRKRNAFIDNYRWVITLAQCDALLHGCTLHVIGVVGSARNTVEVAVGIETFLLCEHA